MLGAPSATIHASPSASTPAKSEAAAPSFRVRIIASPIDTERIIFAVHLLSGPDFSEVSDWPLKRETTRSEIIAAIAADAALGGFAFDVLP